MDEERESFRNRWALYPPTKDEFTSLFNLITDYVPVLGSHKLIDKLNLSKIEEEQVNPVDAKYLKYGSYAFVGVACAIEEFISLYFLTRGPLGWAGYMGVKSLKKALTNYY